MKKIFVILLGLLLVFFFNKIGQAETDINKFDILGIRLGMTLDQVKKEIKKTFPEGKIEEDPRLTYWDESKIIIRSVSDEKRGAIPTVIKSLMISFAKKPFGEGAYDIRLYQPFNPYLNEPDLLAPRADISKKYGNPNYTRSPKSSELDACWGECKEKNRVTGKGLVVTLIRSHLDLCLSDLTPRKIYEEKEREKTRGKVKF